MLESGGEADVRQRADREQGPAGSEGKAEVVDRLNDNAHHHHPGVQILARVGCNGELRRPTFLLIDYSPKSISREQVTAPECQLSLSRLKGSVYLRNVYERERHHRGIDWKMRWVEIGKEKEREKYRRNRRDNERKVPGHK